MAPKTTNDNKVQSFDFTGNDSVDSILQAQKKRWVLLDGNSITYSFVSAQTAPLYPKQYSAEAKDKGGNAVEEPISPLDSTLVGYIRDIFTRVFGSVIAVDFTKKSETVSISEDKVEEITDFGTLRIMYRAFAPNLNGSITLGRGKFPGENEEDGNFYLKGGTNYDPGTLNYTTILHELGHTLGLKHPFDTSGTTLPLGQDNNTFTVMTYNDDISYYNGALAVSLMPYDIQALQHLYGARANNNDNTTYVFRDVDQYSVNDVDYYTFAAGHSKSTLWDSGGQDTLDFSAITAFPTLSGTDGFDYRFELKQGGFLTEYSAYNGATYTAYNPSFLNPNGSKGAWNAGQFNTLRYGAVLAFSPLNNSLDATIENLFGTQRNDYIQGNNVANLIKANGGNDNLEGLDGDDTLDGGLGRDSIFGGQGSDIYYVDDIADTITELTNEGAELVYSTAFGYALSDNVENLTLMDGATSGTGNGLANTITGNEKDNMLDGKEGDDFLYGQGEDDKLIGGAGADLVNGDIGSDTASYYTSSSGVTVNLATGQATDGDAQGDQLVSIENLEGSNSADSLTGNAQSNSLRGLGGDDTVYGGDGIDALNGDEGNDQLSGGMGIDTLSGGDDNDTLFGEAGDDVLYGQNDNDTLDGGLGNDSMFGGAGNDIYSVESATDKVAEYSNQGRDTVTSSITYTLGENLENLTLIGKELISGMGNNLENIILGNDAGNFLFGDAGKDILSGGDGDDTLDGGVKSDVMSGGLGNDIYVVDSSTDQVVENENEGTDTVNASSNYGLSNNLENLNLTGSNAINGIGNDLSNIINGNDAVNYIYAGEAADFVNGAAGDDYLYGEIGNDSIFGKKGDDNLNGGLGDDVISGGQGKDWLVGDLGDDRLLGGADRDHIVGGTGNDVIIGGSGNDWLTGGAGADKFIFHSWKQGVDFITDFHITDGDRLVISAKGFDKKLEIGTLSADQFSLGSGAKDESDRFIYDSSTGKLFFDADGVGSAKQVQLATLSKGLSLTQSDISVIA